MISSLTRQLAIQALKQMQGDDYQRALAAFRGMSERQMQEHHGNGKTRQQVLDEIRERHSRIEDAITDLNYH